MKAYQVDCTFCNCGVYVFAENANKAKAFAEKYTYVHMNNHYDEYISLRVYRLPKLDCEYKPKEFSKQYELDWGDLEDRKIIAKHGYCPGQCLDAEHFHNEWYDLCEDCEIRNECSHCKE